MKHFQSTFFTLLMTFSLAFAGESEAAKHSQKHAKNHHRSSSHSNTHAKQKNHYKNKSNENQRATTKKVNHQAAQTFNTKANISPTAVKHIKDRHWYNANQGANTSHFKSNMTDKKLNKVATKTINKGSQRPSKHGQGRSTYQYKFNKPVGTTATGQKAHSLRVVTDSQNNVITAFPVN